MVIMITGAPGLGKTTLAMQLAADHEAEVLHTDDYLGNPAGIELMVSIMTTSQSSLIIEGTLVWQLLYEVPGFVPDLVYRLVPAQAVPSHHKGLEALIKNRMDQWVDDHPEVSVVERVGGPY